MFWRISVLLSLALVVSAQQDDKPSPVPARMHKAPARAVEVSESYVPTPAQEVEWTSAQGGTAVFFSDNARGKRSASGALIDPGELIAAHSSLPFGTLVRVTNIKNGKEVTVRIVDRISASSSHIISVSEKAAVDLDFRRTGIGQVKIMPVTKAER